MTAGGDTITLHEVGPRDGLQSLPFALSVQEKVTLIRDLIATGLTHIEATSFINPRLIPQHADADHLCPQLPTLVQGYSAYVPNIRGVERALRHPNITRLGSAFGVTDALTEHNINMDNRSFLAELGKMHERSKSSGRRFFAGVSGAFGCPFAGRVTVDSVLHAVEAAAKLGIDEIEVADTIGTANPAAVKKLGLALRTRFPEIRFIWHFHDVFGNGVANVLAAADAGFRDFDSSVAGIGGCPFAPGAAGNVATEELVYALNRIGGGLASNVDLAQLLRVARRIVGWVGPRAGSRLARMGEQAWAGPFLSELGGLQ